jgi:hypothetical protein
VLAAELLGRVGAELPVLLHAPGQDVPALPPLPDTVNLDGGMVTVGIPGPRSAFALKPCRMVLLHVVTHLGSGAI